VKNKQRKRGNAANEHKSEVRCAEKSGRKQSSENDINDNDICITVLTTGINYHEIMHKF